jgi:hypothetical protein
MLFARLKYLPRDLSLNIYPATVVFNNRAISGKGPAALLTQEWIDFVHALNPTKKGFHTIIGKARGWVNIDPEDGKVFAESLSMGGNIAQVLNQRGRFVQVRAFSLADLPPDPGQVNFQETPWLVHKFTCLTRRGVPFLPGAGVEAYFPFLFADSEAWVEERFVDLFDHMPEPLVPTKSPPAGFPAVALQGAVIRQSPGGVKISRLEADTPVNILAEVRGWAKVGEQRWVDLANIRQLSSDPPPEDD